MVYDAVGNINYPKTKRPNQRGLILTKDLKAGEKLKDGINFKSLRPGGGIEPKYADVINNKPIKKDLKKGTLLQWDMM
jgi:sialic acid synthase SpsE